MVPEKQIPFSERRILPRCAIDTEVKIQIESGGETEEYSARSINISLRSFELSCDDALIQAILAQNAYPHTCETSFAIAEVSRSFRLKTQVLTHRRLSRDSYQLVLRFIDLETDIQERLLNQLASLRVMDNKAQKVSLAL